MSNDRNYGRNQLGQDRYTNNPYASGGATAFDPERAMSTRANFLINTYMHLFGAMAAFTLIEVFFFKSGMALPMAKAMLGTSWLLVLGAFMVVGWMARRFAYRSSNMAMQYLGLAGVVVAYAVIFVPMLVLAEMQVGGGIIQSAAMVTLTGFAGLTGVAWWSRTDFSFLGGLLKWGGVLALVAIVGGVLFGFNLGTWFSVAMIGLAGAAILYDTSKILREFPEDRYVAASLELFASVALMFWYVLRLFMNRR